MLTLVSMDTHTIPSCSLQVLFHSHCLFLIQHKYYYFVISFGMVLLQHLLNASGFAPVFDDFDYLCNPFVGLAFLGANADSDWIVDVLLGQYFYIFRPGG